MALLDKNDKKLVKRYLVWCYKTTKEELDRVDRKFTQLKVDDFILRQLTDKSAQSQYKKLLNDFRLYIAKKHGEAQADKFSGNGSKAVRCEYLFLKNRFAAIEKAIAFFLGKKELKVIAALYEQEMTARILQSREHT
ncbi:MAG: hypothetical protein WC676_07850 [Candidatus Omnitrophota bacterium]